MVDLFAVILVGIGLFLFASATLGLIRLPDFYCRMHATGKCDTLGALLSLTGLAIYHGPSLVSLKIIFIVLFIFLANPTATHAIGRAALMNQVKPWTREPSPPSPLSAEGGEK
ncbi:MAG: monovalent cation/H(+) antiporter subunit G [Deltaproteobacteria bacterium]|nr:monovalent cation/H(+) antiporter subunit G [Deltaproteobacteria bacterium]